MYRIRLNTAKGPSQHGLYLPARVLEGLGFTPGSRCMLQVGQKVVRTSLGVAPQSKISAELKQKLRMPPGVLRLHVDAADDRLFLGPFLGILAKPQSSSPYGEQTGFFRRLIARAKAMHIYAFVFGPDDVNFENASITGHRPYKDTTTWVTRRCPVPDVVFDRGFFKGAEKTRVHKMKERLVKEWGVRLFNEDIGNKWDVYQALIQDPVLVQHLPETVKADTQETMSDFIDRHKLVYVKPASGNQGRNVFRVRNRHNRISYEAHTRQGHIIRSSVPNIAAFMHELAATRERCPFIVQQAINLTRVQGHAADVRALVQRDRAGKWQLTGAGVRIGGSSLVSNLHAGGSAAKLDVLVPRPGRKARVAELEARIAKLTLRVAETLGQRNLLGELGVDLGVDDEGHLWIIEVNLRPGRATFRRAGLTEAWRRSGIAPLEFTQHLWGSASGGEEPTTVPTEVAPELAIVAEPATPVLEALAEPEPTATLGGYMPIMTRRLL